jgi:ElaB/YqjD/DUF883 family membrane-anchored ribosome-binding protein
MMFLNTASGVAERVRENAGDRVQQARKSVSSGLSGAASMLRTSADRFDQAAHRAADSVETAATYVRPTEPSKLRTLAAVAGGTVGLVVMIACGSMISRAFWRG